MRVALSILATATLLQFVSISPVQALETSEISANQPEAATSQEDQSVPDGDSSNEGFTADKRTGQLSGGDGDATVTRTAVLFLPDPGLDPQHEADVSVGGGTVEASADSNSPLPGDNCARYSLPEFNWSAFYSSEFYSSEFYSPEFNWSEFNWSEFDWSGFSAEEDFFYSPVCIRWRACGGERVDDVVSGHIAGRDATGKYQEYLGEMVGYLSSEATLPGGPLDINSVNDLLLTQGLGERPGDDLIPVFYWCANYDAFGVFDPVDITSVRFSWDLSYEEVYDIPGVRSDLYIQLTSQLELYNPEPGAVPPIDGGYTFVQWPTWFFLENPLEQEHIFTTNDIDTFRIDLRATLLRVDWTFGDSLVASCTVSDMKKYNADNDDPIEDLPPCHHIFDQVVTEDLTTTVFYQIHEKVRSRPSASLDHYPNIAWSDYLGRLTIIELSTTVSDYEIHQIASVNVPNQ
jgi:hypothetical protein